MLVQLNGGQIFDRQIIVGYGVYHLRSLIKTSLKNLWVMC